MIKVQIEGLPQEVKPEFLRSLVREHEKWPNDLEKYSIVDSGGDILITVADGEWHIERITS